MNILGVITARGDSKGVPWKILKHWEGSPYRIYNRGRTRERSFTDLIVSTNDEEIASVCRAYGANIPFMQPNELATDTSGHLEVMRYAIRFMENKKNLVYDYAVILQPTSPFRLAEDIDKTIKKIIEQGADSAFSMCEIEPSQHPMKVKKMDGDVVRSYCMEEKVGTHRQDFPVAYKRSGAVYVTRRDLVMNNNILFGDFAVGHIVPLERSIDIDSQFDWIKAEYMLEDLKKRGYEF